MKLYSAQLSPFAARVRLAIYAKSLPVEILPPPGGGTKSPEYLAVNPMGKLPALVLDDGTVIPESDTIVEYLADAFPEARLRAAKPADIARGRLLARMAELYVMAPGGALFGQMNPATRDPAAVDAAIAKTDDGLAHLNLFMTDDAYAVGDTITTADCALAPLLFFQGVFGQVFEKGDLLARHGKVAAYWRGVQKDPAVHRVLTEMKEGLAAFRGA
jgi:glutathione S-transferase